MAATRQIHLEAARRKAIAILGASGDFAPGGLAGNSAGKRELVKF